MSRVWKCLKNSVGWAFAFCSAFLAFVPESFFQRVILPAYWVEAIAALPVFCSNGVQSAEEKEATVILVNVVLNRILLLVGAIVVAFLLAFIISCIWRRVVIKQNGYHIVVKYGDLFKMQKCQKVINFDECFTTEVGLEPGQIKPKTVCGQYLKSNPLTKQEMESLLQHADLAPMESKSAYRSQDRYESGTLVSRGDYLLMAFAKLDPNGRGKMPWEDYLSCLQLLWKEIDKHYAQMNVCIPVLRAGIVTIKDREPTHQELLDVIINSYKLSATRINTAHHLIVVCRKNDGIELEKIGKGL